MPMTWDEHRAELVEVIVRAWCGVDDLTWRRTTDEWERAWLRSKGDAVLSALEADASCRFCIEMHSEAPPATLATADNASCVAEAHTWGRCTLPPGHKGWHRAAFDGGRRWPPHE